MSDKLVWSSNMTQDYFLSLDPESAKAELVDWGYEPEMLAGLDEEGLNDLIASDDYMWQNDAYEFEQGMVPMISSQTKDGIVLMSGTAGTWRGDFKAGKAVYADELAGGDICRDCDEIRIDDVDGGLHWYGCHHDGCHNMGLYALPEDYDLFINFMDICMHDYIENELDYDDESTAEDIIEYAFENITLEDINDYCDFSKVPEVCEPIRNTANMAVGEACEVEEDYASDKAEYEANVNQLKQEVSKDMDVMAHDYYDKGMGSDEFEDAVEDFFDGDLEEGCEECRIEEAVGDVKIKDWVAQMYPEEFQLDRINPDITFQELADLMEQGKDVYRVASVNGDGFDSAVREEIFVGLSEILDKPYDYFYDLWLDSDDDFIDIEPIEESCEELDEAKSKNVEALAAELEELKEDFEDFGPEGFYAVPFDNFAKEFPEFTNTCVKTWLKDMELVEPEDLANPEYLNQLWSDGELIQPEDWEILLDGAERLTTFRKDKGIQWEKINAAHSGIDK